MADAWKIRMTAEVAEQIRRHGADMYPHECCGALLGRGGAGEEKEVLQREIVDVLALTNQREDSPRNRFSVAPRDVIEADRAAQARGLEVVGWYHSHPDHPARPSEYDREHAWPWYSYVFVKVDNGEAREMASWRLREDREGYEEESIEIGSGASAGLQEEKGRTVSQGSKLVGCRGRRFELGPSGRRQATSPGIYENALRIEEKLWL